MRSTLRALVRGNARADAGNPPCIFTPVEIIFLFLEFARSCWASGRADTLASKGTLLVLRSIKIAGGVGCEIEIGPMAC